MCSNFISRKAKQLKDKTYKQRDGSLNTAFKKNITVWPEERSILDGLLSSYSTLEIIQSVSRRKYRRLIDSLGILLIAP